MSVMGILRQQCEANPSKGFRGSRLERITFFSSRVKGIGGRSRSIYKVEANLDWIHKPRLGDVLASKLVPIHGKLGV